MLSAASVKEDPVDPHSDKPFKYFLDDKFQVYSVGPDGKDDLAKQAIDYWSTSPDTRGDILFELTR